MNSQVMRIGPEVPSGSHSWTPGDCPECGGQCAPECGRHPLGCIYGGMIGYWMIAEGCGLDHGEAS